LFPDRRAQLFATALAVSAGTRALAQDAHAHRLAEAVLLHTLQEQGGLSHASGQRPELGPTLLSPLVLREAGTIRVGLSPTAFAADGNVRLEYDTAAAHNHARVEITATGPFTVWDEGSGALVGGAGAGETFVFTRNSDPGTIRVAAGSEAAGVFDGPLRVRPAGPDVLLVVNSMRRINRLAPLVDGSFPLTPASYRGELEVRRSESEATRLRLVNVVAIEPYVAGVVVNESLATFHVEALKAQAVAARGYALANLGRFASRGFDLDDSTLSQVYRGQSSETPAALQAASDTAGLVALYGGRILSALYSSSMGGHSEDNEYVFPSGGYPGTNADPALRGIHDSEEPLRADLSTDAGSLAFYTTLFRGAYEVSAATGSALTAQHRWTRTRSAAELLARLKDPSRPWGVPASARALHDIVVTIRGRSGRMMQAVVSGDWGETTISGWSDLRALATLTGVTPGGTAASSAPNSPSTFTLLRDGAGHVTEVTFYGGGFGHNVGMSQYGAHGRALRGQDFSQILAGYYTGMQLGTAPVLVTASNPARFDFEAPSDGATLVVESYGCGAISLDVNGRSFELVPRGSAARRGSQDAETALDALLRRGRNRVKASAECGGAAVVFLRLDRPREPGRAPAR
jgi:SpoIID/LytB domain protein